MSELHVEIVRLDPMQVGAFYGFGAEPEAEAMDKLLAWAVPQGLFDDGVTHRVFGFNNPSPSAGSPHYGYEFWLELKADDLAAAATPDVEHKIFAGGLFAAARCRGVAAVPATWRALVTYLEDSRYTMTGGQCLEQHTGRLHDDMEALDFVLYQPIAG
jgi:DNA gyrase inhibitor GyrI